MEEVYQDITKVYLNGRFVAPEQAAISPFDRGFIFGDGIYEVVPAYGGRPFRWLEHLTRLNGNLNTLAIPEPLSATEWQDMLSELLVAGGDRDQYVYLQVTRGVAPRDHVYPDQPRPTVFAYARLLPPIAQILQDGVAAVTAADFRWQRCDIKSTSLMGNVWLRQQAAERDAGEAILVRNGEVSEGAATNVFAVIDNVVRTAPHGPALLPGITRDLIVELMARSQVSYEERAFTESEMLAAQEVWLSSSTKELVPVIQINNQPIADGKPGSVFQRVFELFQDYKAQCRAGKAA